MDSKILGLIIVFSVAFCAVSAQSGESANEDLLTNIKEIVERLLHKSKVRNYQFNEVLSF